MYVVPTVGKSFLNSSSSLYSNLLTDLYFLVQF